MTGEGAAGRLMGADTMGDLVTGDAATGERGIDGEGERNVGCRVTGAA